MPASMTNIKLAERTERLERERAERTERLEMERVERTERLEMERAERMERLEMERSERMERAERERSERTERAEMERSERTELAEIERIENAKIAGSVKNDTKTPVKEKTALPPKEKKKYKCSICKQFGHNSRTCPEATTQKEVSVDEPVVVTRNLLFNDDDDSDEDDELLFSFPVSSEKVIEYIHFGDMKGGGNTILSVSDYTKEAAFDYAIKNQYRVVVYAGGKNYYLKGKNYTVAQACAKIEAADKTTTKGKYAAIMKLC